MLGYSSAAVAAIADEAPSAARGQNRALNLEPRSWPRDMQPLRCDAVRPLSRIAVERAAASEGCFHICFYVLNRARSKLGRFSADLNA